MTTTTWHPVCRLNDLETNWSEVALIGGRQIAVVRTAAGDVFAFDHVDPTSGALVMARGIVGRSGEQQTVTSPLYKEIYDLSSGRCLSGQDVTLPVFPTHVAEDGTVSVAV